MVQDEVLRSNVAVLILLRHATSACTLFQLSDCRGNVSAGRLPQQAQLLDCITAVQVWGTCRRATGRGIAAAVCTMPRVNFQPLAVSSTNAVKLGLVWPPCQSPPMPQATSMHGRLVERDRFVLSSDSAKPSYVILYDQCR